MGEHDRIIELSEHIKHLLRSSVSVNITEELATYINSREKALNKIIAALIISDKESRMEVVHGKLHRVVLPTAFLSAVAPEVEIEGDGGSYITLTIRRY